MRSPLVYVEPGSEILAQRSYLHNLWSLDFTVSDGLTRQMKVGVWQLDNPLLLISQLTGVLLESSSSLNVYWGERRICTHMN